MNLEAIIAHSVERIIEYGKEQKSKKDDFYRGVELGIYVALSALQSDIETYSLDEKILERMNFDMDLDKIL